MDYKLLKLTPDFDAIHSYLSCGEIPYYSVSDTMSSKEYDHQGFEHEFNSLNTVLSHAAAMINRLDIESDDKSAKAALARDYHNAIKCLLLGKHGWREQIDNLTKYMLLNDWETAINALSQAYEENKGKAQNQLIDANYVPDYGKLLLKMGDAALFDGNNLSKALCEYEVATFNWRTKYANRNDDYSLEVGTKEKIRSYIQLFSAIYDGRYIEDISFLSDGEKRIIKCYKEIQNKYNLHEEVVIDIETLIDDISQYMGVNYGIKSTPSRSNRHTASEK